MIIRAVRCSYQSGDDTYTANPSLAGQQVSGEFKLAAGQQESFPFRFGVPVDLPFTELGGQHLPGVRIGVQTELDIAKARDKSVHDVILRAAQDEGFSTVHSVLVGYSAHSFAQKLEIGRSKAYPKIKDLEFYFTVRGEQTLVRLNVDKKGLDKRNELTVPTDGAGADVNP